MEQIKGRIIKSLGGFYYLKCEDGRELECRARGAFRNKNIKPCVYNAVFVDGVDNALFT